MKKKLLLVVLSLGTFMLSTPSFAVWKCTAIAGSSSSFPAKGATLREARRNALASCVNNAYRPINCQLVYGSCYRIVYRPVHFRCVATDGSTWVSTDIRFARHKAKVQCMAKGRPVCRVTCEPKR